MAGNDWRAVIENAPVQRGARFTVSVVFFNDETKLEPQSVDCDGTLADLTARCIAFTGVLQTATPIAKSELQPGIELDLTPVPPVIKPPTDEEIAEAQYLTDRGELDRLLASQTAGMPVDEQALKTMQATAAGEYRPEYDS